MRFWTTLQLRSVLEMPCFKDFSKSALYTFSFLYNLKDLLKLFSFNKWLYATNNYFNPRTFLRSCLYVVEGTSEPRMTEIRLPLHGNETLRPLGVATGNALSVTRSEDTYEKTPPVGQRQPMTSLPACHNKSAAGRIHHQLFRLYWLICLKRATESGKSTVFLSTMASTSKAFKIVCG